jgi:nucleoside-diphosphate-sugar epimerase
VRIAIIGANGFIGRSISEGLVEKGHRITAIIRDHKVQKLPFTESILYVSSADANQDWKMLLDGIDVVLHLASPKATDKPSQQQKREYYKTIVEGTLSIARAAVETSVQRMIFISSIKVNGEITNGLAFDINSTPIPQTSYGECKLTAEIGLSKISEKQHLATTVIRPPIIYGPGNFGNIYSMIKFLHWFPGHTLPIGGIKNNRSLLFIGNLTSAIVCCVEDSSSKSHLFLLRDRAMISTTGLCSMILSILNKDINLTERFSAIIRLFMTFCMPRLSEKLFESLEIDDNTIFNTLGWDPPFSTQEGLAKTISHLEGK